MQIDIVIDKPFPHAASCSDFISSLVHFTELNWEFEAVVYPMKTTRCHPRGRLYHPDNSAEKLNIDEVSPSWSNSSSLMTRRSWITTRYHPRDRIQLLWWQGEAHAWRGITLLIIVSSQCLCLPHDHKFSPLQWLQDISPPCCKAFRGGQHPHRRNIGIANGISSPPQHPCLLNDMHRCCCIFARKQRSAHGWTCQAPLALNLRNGHCSRNASTFLCIELLSSVCCSYTFSCSHPPQHVTHAPRRVLCRVELLASIVLFSQMTHFYVMHLHVVSRALKC